MFWDKFLWFWAGFGLLLLMGMPEVLYENWPPSIWWQDAVYCLLALALVFWLYRFARKHGLLTRTGPLLTWQGLTIILATFGGLTLADRIGHIFIHMAGGTSTLNQTALEESFVSYSPAFILITTTMIAPLFEEVILRGIFFEKLFTKHAKTGLVMSSLIFGLLHMPTDLGSAIIYMGAGFVFGLTYYKIRRLDYTIAAHALANVLSSLEFLVNR